MSVQITNAFVEQYKANVYHLTQQKGSKMRRAVRVENVNGKSAFFEQIGATSARKRTSRHSDTPRMDTPHARRRVTTESYDWADLVDGEDQIRMLIDPCSQYAEAAAMAMGRAMDDEIVRAADAVAYTGVDGSTSTAYNTAMTVGVTTRFPGTTSGNLGLNVAKILEAAEKLGTQDVDPDEEKFLFPNARQVKSLLNDNRISSADFNAVKPLVEGQISKFGGFTIIPCNRITTDANSYDKVLYWAKGGMLLGLGKDITTKIGERADKNYACQVFGSMDIGATRMEEVRVGYIECHASSGPQA